MDLQELYISLLLLLLRFITVNSHWLLTVITGCSILAVMRSVLVWLASIQLLGLARCQFPPPLKDVITIQSKFGNGISISYKEVCSKLLDPHEVS